MDWSRLGDWLDNPILVKHFRSRLRRQPFLTALVVVQALCLCVVWAGYQLTIFMSGGAFELLAILQGIILVVVGGSQVSAAVNGARCSGILDFHRVSPLSPAELTLGFFFGAPIREYLLFASTLPYAAICLAIGAPTVRGMVQILIVLLTSAWIFHALGLLNALIAKPRPNARGAMVAIVIFLVLFFNALRMGRFTPSAVLFDGDLRSDFYGYSFPWLAVVLFFEVPLLAFLYIASSRKMDSERNHAFSKLQALGALGILGFLTLGIIWRQSGYDILELSALYIWVVIAILLTATVTPGRAEYLKGLWRARDRGRTHLHWWDDLALNRVYLFIACALVLVGGNVTWSQAWAGRGFDRSSTAAGFPLAIAMGVLVVGYVGLGLQYFLLQFGARGRMYFGLFLFFTWLLPLVAGAIVAMPTSSMIDTAPSQALLSLSPVVGIASIAAPSGATSSGGAIACQVAAITPPLLFAFLFNGLLVAARRRTYRTFQASVEAEAVGGESPKSTPESSDIDEAVPTAK
jgi:hypothetical protein